MKLPSFCGDTERLALPDPIRKEHTDLKSAIKKFLTSAAETQPEKQFCPQCGQQMSYLETDFCIYGEDSSWRVQIPVCSCSGGSEVGRGPTGIS